MIDHNSFSPRTALFHTLGCKLNFAETSTVARIFASRGIMRVQQGDVPDIVVVNTCSVTELADKKCRQLIRQFVRRYPEATVIVTGCYAQLKPEEVAAIPGVAIVAGNDRKADLAEFLDRWLETRSPQMAVIPAKEIDSFTPSCSRGDRTRWFLKVQDGCDYWCTYCTIPMARGRSRSASVESLVAQARQAAAEGAREIVLTGVNIGDFGHRTGETFEQLCHALARVEGIERYRISSIEPNLLSDSLIDWIATEQGSRFMPHFHIPLQSGSDEVLRLMRRRYDTDTFRRKIEKIRATLPDAFIGVDLMVGCRGETAECFDECKRFVESLPVSRLHVFPYSERPGTRALGIDHIVSQEEKHRRARIMIGVSERMLADFAGRYVGTVRPVLLEHQRSDGSMSGFTDNYLRVSVEPRPELANTVVNVRLTGLDGEELRGEVVD
ncbi:MAG: tRNA (N(6)-L-threonylcarbamoyladenosine(37)-C(2))-methylthiotransferase MtaB [Bacteroides sp.]|nr:tRNA (N(6)-L-threonylcarbamoyladenosine(37)-C(2))-methylthiotransferase MtaB [Bacteroides sp.]